jgi:hypothetical protein
MAERTSIGDAFVGRYLEAVRHGLGDAAGSPTLRLRTMAIVYDEALGEAARALSGRVNAMSTNTWSSLADAEAKEYLTRYRELSGVLLVSPSHLAALREWSELIGPEDRRPIEAAARQHAAFVYGVRRSAKASLFVLVGDGQRADALVERLIASPSVIEGLGPTVDGPSPP